MYSRRNYGRLRTMSMVNVHGDLQRMKVVQGKDLTFTKRSNTLLYLYCFYCTEYTLKLLLHYLTYHKNYVAQVKFQKNQKISGRVLTLAIFLCFKPLYLAKSAPLLHFSHSLYLKPGLLLQLSPLPYLKPGLHLHFSTLTSGKPNHTNTLSHLIPSNPLSLLHRTPMHANTCVHAHACVPVRTHQTIRTRPKPFHINLFQPSRNKTLDKICQPVLKCRC